MSVSVCVSVSLFVYLFVSASLHSSGGPPFPRRFLVRVGRVRPSVGVSLCERKPWTGSEVQDYAGISDTLCLRSERQASPQRVH